MPAAVREPGSAGAEDGGGDEQDDAGQADLDAAADILDAQREVAGNTFQVEDGEGIEGIAADDDDSGFGIFVRNPEIYPDSQARTQLWPLMLLSEKLSRWSTHLRACPAVVLADLHSAVHVCDVTPGVCRRTWPMLTVAVHPAFSGICTGFNICDKLVVLHQL
jgi:hypothetical protein